MTIPIPVLGALTAAFVWSAWVCIVDVRTLRIPGALAWGGAVPAAAVGFVADRPVSALLGAAASAVLYFCLRIISPSALGGGDLRLAPTAGALAGVTGVTGWLVSAAGAFVVTAVVGLLLAAARRTSLRRTPVPHGPGMVSSALLVAVLGLT